MSFLESEWYGSSVRDWLLVAGLTVVGFAVLRLLQALLVGRLAALARKTTTEWDDIFVQALRQTKALFLLIIACFASVRILIPEAAVGGALGTVLVLATCIQGGIWASAGLRAWLDAYRERKMAKDAAAVTTIDAAGLLARIALWAVVILLVLDNLGVEITALVAGLGIGGIAIALALQNILGDLFASLSIVLDKPFVIGDFIVVDSYLGAVEHVGLKTTRIRSLSGEQLVFANGDLLQSRLRNYGRMAERRVVFALGVTYQTPRESLRKIPGIIRAAIEAQGQTRFDRSHFKAYGESSLDFETVYYVLVPDYNTYMDVQQEINLRIHEEFEREGVEFAYPTRTVHVAGEAGDAEATAAGAAAAT
jgi:small-conductance mechanosensitive channel